MKSNGVQEQLQVPPYSTGFDLFMVSSVWNIKLLPLFQINILVNRETNMEYGKTFNLIQFRDIILE